MLRRAARLAALLSALPAFAASPVVPRVEGLSVTTAIADAGGDYESRKRLAARVSDGWMLEYSASVPDLSAAGGVRTVSTTRLIHDADAVAARSYRNRFEDATDEDYPGTTALGASTAVLRELRASGAAKFALIGDDHWLGRAAIGGLAAGVTTNHNTRYSGVLEKRGNAELDVLVNGHPQRLPVLIAAGRFTSRQGQTMDASLSLLDDPANPIALEWRISDARLRVVRIDFPQPAEHLSRELKAARRLVLPGLLFDFGSARLRPESTAALAAIVDVIGSVPDAALLIEGHTDSIGDGARNLRLSQARADAVRTALIERDTSLSARLTARGFGAAVPAASNETLEGRARNRRVELVLR